MQKDLTNVDLSVGNDSLSQLGGRNTSEGRAPSLKNQVSNTIVNDFVSDNASVINQQFRDADKEDLHQTM